MRIDARFDQDVHQGLDLFHGLDPGGKNLLVEGHHLPQAAERKVIIRRQRHPVLFRLLLHVEHPGLHVVFEGSGRCSRRIA